MSKTLSASRSQSKTSLVPSTPDKRLNDENTLAMRIVTYNLRFDSQPDNITVQQSLDSLQNPLQQPHFLTSGGKEHPWSTRRLRVAQLLLSEGITVASFQEALVRQIADLSELFGPEWSWIGVGRDDGNEAGEYSPIFFKNTVRLLSHDFFWLSNTPFVPSKYPGAGSIRVCTAAHFSIQVENTERRFTLLNTHLDDQSNEQRKLGASLLLARARYEAVRTGCPVFITGDFNSPATENHSGVYNIITSFIAGDSNSDCAAYNIITGITPPVAIDATFAEKYAVNPDQLPSFKMLDLRGEAPRRSVSANYATFTDFTAPHDTSGWSRIDFMFGGSNEGWTAQSQIVGTSLSDDGVLASDHRPVFTDVSI